MKICIFVPCFIKPFNTSQWEVIRNTNVRTNTEKNLSSEQLSFSQTLGTLPSINRNKKKTTQGTHLNPFHQAFLFQFAITEILWQILQ